ncbi:hypothetical protein B1218_37405, partial [Pseudomonas ogarae]
MGVGGWARCRGRAAGCVAQRCGVDVAVGQQVLRGGALVGSSEGVGGVAGVAFVVLLGTLGSGGSALEGLDVIAGVDRIMDVARAALNGIGNGLAVLVIARWEGMY